MRSISLDIARSFAISLVLLAHIGQTIDSPMGSFFGIPHFYYVSLGGLAVTIFLILSGRVLEMRYGSKNINYPQFLTKRILRIYPVYYLSLIFGLIIYSLHSYHETGTFLAGFSELGVGDIILSITGTYAFAGRWGGPFDLPSWFIGLIMTMYILFPFLSREIKKRPIIFICILFLISSLSRVILGKYEILPDRPLDWFPPCRVFEFSLGIYLAIILPRIELDHLELLRRLDPFTSFISEISFPLFLVHYPLLDILEYLTRRGINQLLAICFFVTSSLFLSRLILTIDKRIPRTLIVEKIDGILSRNKFGLTKI